MICVDIADNAGKCVGVVERVLRRLLRVVGGLSRGHRFLVGTVGRRLRLLDALRRALIYILQIAVIRRRLIFQLIRVLDQRSGLVANIILRRTAGCHQQQNRRSLQQSRYSCTFGFHRLDSPPGRAE